MFCTECGSSVGGAKFCSECGAPANPDRPLSRTYTENYEEESSETTEGNSNALKALGVLLVIAAIVVFSWLRIAPQNADSQAETVSDTTSSEVSAPVEEAAPSSSQIAKDSVAALGFSEIDGRWPSMCQEVMGSGWSCWVDLRVYNSGAVAWDGDLTAELLAEDGSRSSSSDSEEINELTGTFWGPLNPSTPMEWAVYFKVGPGQKFIRLDVMAGDVIVKTVPICIGSTEDLSMGC